MGERDKIPKGQGLSRREFIQASAAAAAAGGAMQFMYAPEIAAAYENDPTNFQITYTTCPYCSASCGQRVVVDKRAGSPTLGEVIDVYGDFESPFNAGGLCAKGAGTYQLVTNPRRLGYPTVGTHPANPVFKYDAAYDASGVAYKRDGDGGWYKVALPTALDDIADRLIAARAVDATGWNPGAGKYNSKSVAFFGSSHLNNEPNYLFRKLIANFGTSNTEHQARI